MGLLDDLQMGFGLKERTEDYDARTARTIAANEMAQRRGRGGDAMALAQARNPSHFSYIGDDAGGSGGARTFLDRIGGESYNPRPVVDNRTMFQRLLFSPESDPSPTPYAIGPVTLDQPLPAFGILGLLSGMLGGRGGEEDVSTRSVVRPMLRPEGFTPYVSAPPSEAEVEAERPYLSPTTYTNVFSTNRMLGMPYSQPFDYTQFSLISPEADGGDYDPAYPVSRDYPTGTEVTPEQIEDYLGRVEAEGQDMTLITRGPHAGKYIDSRGRLVMP